MNETTPDPFDSLMNAASDKALWFFIGGPVVLLVLVAAIYAVIIWIRRRKDDAEWKQAAAEGAQGEADLGEADLGEADLGQASQEPEAKVQEPTPQREIEPPQDSRSTLETPPEPASSIPEDVEDIRKTDRSSWIARFRQGLSRTRGALQESVASIFKGSVKIDESILERLHEALYRADIGVATADKLVQAVKSQLGKDQLSDWEQVSTCLKGEAKAILRGSQRNFTPPPSGPFVVLVVGVNGVGKTTSIGKLAAHFLADDKQVLLAAADTFRAAAIEQLETWAKRLGVDVVRHQAGSDPAAVAYDGVKAAVSRKMDVLLIDTAGRLHNKTELMAELGKVNRVIGKDLPGAPHATWLVIDATTGQNAVMQVKAFKEVVGLTGLIVTKLDGTAKGGVLIGIADQFGLPIHFVGVGEKAADLRPFDADDYVDSLF